MTEQNETKDPTRMPFTELGIRRMNAPNQLRRISAHTGRKNLKQASIWDLGQPGLSLMISAGGAKTFRVQFKLHGQWLTHRLGRFPNLQINEARRLAEEYRAKAEKGIDPRVIAPAPADRKSFAHVVDRFIEEHAKVNQRTWDQTERILKITCKQYLPRKIDEITKPELREFLKSFVQEGHPYKARLTDAYLRKLFNWAREEDLITISPMDGVRKDYPKRVRDRVYSPDEIAAIWQAASNLEPIAGAYFKLLLLLAPRRSALALMQWSHLNDQANPTLWVTPHELTKSRKSSDDKPRTYLTPLPALAQRILKGLPRSEARVFPTVPVARMKSGVDRFIDTRLLNNLVKAGAPKDFKPHAIRHTIATYLEKQGYGLWERGLILNHAEQGVTAGYSHSHALELKRKLLEEWAGYVEGLVQPAGVKVLR